MSKRTELRGTDGEKSRVGGTSVGGTGLMCCGDAFFIVGCVMCVV